MTQIDPTHPGGVVNETAEAKGWKLGNAACWRVVKAVVMDAQSDVFRMGALEALEAIERLGNAGPPRP